MWTTTQNYTLNCILYIYHLEERFSTSCLSGASYGDDYKTHKRASVIVEAVCFLVVFGGIR